MPATPILDTEQIWALGVPATRVHSSVDTTGLTVWVDGVPSAFGDINPGNQYYYFPDGTVTTSGSASVSIIRAIAGSGTIATSGAATLSITKIVLGAGSVTTTGAADVAVSHVHDYDGTGTVAISGTAEIVTSRSYDGAGLVLVNGQADTGQLRQYVVVGSGALVVSGSAIAAFGRTFDYDGVGIISVGGLALSRIFRFARSTAFKRTFYVPASDRILVVPPDRRTMFAPERIAINTY